MSKKSLFIIIALLISAFLGVYFLFFKNSKEIKKLESRVNNLENKSNLLSDRNDYLEKEFSNFKQKVEKADQEKKETNIDIKEINNGEKTAPFNPGGNAEINPEEAAKKPLELSSVIYTNKQFGFSFKLPKGHEDYAVTAEKNEELAGTYFIYFGFLVSKVDEKSKSNYYEKNGKYYDKILSLAVYPKATYKKFCDSPECKNGENALDCNDCASIFGQNSRYIFSQLEFGNDCDYSLRELYYQMLFSPENFKTFKSGFKFF